MALSFRRLSVSLGPRQVLHEVEAVFEPGQVTAILGPNGAGKSTLARAAVGLIRPVGGAVELDGAPVLSLAAKDRARRIGYLPQGAEVHWNLRADELVALGRLPHRMPLTGPGLEDRAAIAEAMVATGTTSLGDRALDTLSGGERARVLLARVLAGRPDWLIADEPLASLDPAHQIDILDRLGGIARAGAGVVVVLHDLAQAARAADRVLLIDQGRAVAFGPPAAVLTPALLRQVFGIELRFARDGEGRELPVPVARSANPLPEPR